MLFPLAPPLPLLPSPLPPLLLLLRAVLCSCVSALTNSSRHLRSFEVGSVVRAVNCSISVASPSEGAPGHVVQPDQQSHTAHPPLYTGSMLNDSPQPHFPFALGLRKTNSATTSSS